MGMFHHLTRRRVRLRPTTIRNACVLRSSSNIETQNAFMLPVTLEDVVDDIVGNDIGNGLHLDGRRRETWQEPMRIQHNNPSPYIQGLAKPCSHWLLLFYPAKP
jgi:hypothetical protein